MLTANELKRLREMIRRDPELEGKLRDLVAPETIRRAEHFLFFLKLSPEEQEEHLNERQKSEAKMRDIALWWKESR